MWEPAHVGFPEGPTIKTIQCRSKFSISIEISNLARKFQSRRLDFPHKIRLQKSTVGGPPGPKIGNVCKNWQVVLVIGSDFLLEIQFVAMFGQYSFQQYFFGFSTKIGPRWVARSKISFSLEIVNLAQNLDFF